MHELLRKAEGDGGELDGITHLSDFERDPDAIGALLSAMQAESNPPSPGVLAEAVEGPGVEALTLHEARHTYASLMIAAGVNAKAPSTFMGHANIGITLDLYGHLMPGSETEAAGLLDDYLARSAGGSTVAHAVAQEGAAQC